MVKTQVTNWGLFPRIEAEVASFSSLETLRQILSEAPHTIARGLGRCYGDSSLNPNIVSMLGFNQILAFDDTTGRITCQAGVSLAQIIDYALPRGWFLGVTPGTRFVTVGGAIASNVHGKNHHVDGSFSNFVCWLDLMLADGSMVRCSPSQHADLFEATCGGMGLTGIIAQAELQLRPVETAYIAEESLKGNNLEALLDHIEASHSHPYTVAWIDCLARGRRMGRGILMRGHHLPLAELPPGRRRQQPLKLPENRPWQFPGFVPRWILNRYTMSWFNQVYYARQWTAYRKRIVPLDTFFYPLDIIQDWNRAYGRRGFTQYQFVLPRQSSPDGLIEILTRISQSPHPAALAVLKLLGPGSGLLGFSMEGYTLAVDIPIRPGVFELLDELDQRVLAHGGRLYLTKDVRMSPQVFEACYPELPRFRAIKQQVDPDNKFQSLQSRRIGL